MIADSYPEHDRTSCSDSHLVNIDPTGDGCHRCNALAFDQLDALQDKNALLNARIIELEMHILKLKTARKKESK